MAAPIKISIVYPTSSNIFYLDAAQFSDGQPVIYPRKVVQEITSMGVDFSRLRFNRKDYSPFSMMGIRGVSTFDDAKTYADALRELHGYVIKLEWTSGGVAYVAPTTFYMSVDRVVPRAGFIVGGEIVPANAYVDIALTFKGTGVAP